MCRFLAFRNTCIWLKAFCPIQKIGKREAIFSKFHSTGGGHLISHRADNISGKQKTPYQVFSFCLRNYKIVPYIELARKRLKSSLSFFGLRKTMHANRSISRLIVHAPTTSSFCSSSTSYVFDSKAVERAVTLIRFGRLTETSMY